MRMRTWVATGLAVAAAATAGGCGEYNGVPKSGEADALSAVVPLTNGHRDRFDKAGDARFSADMLWVVFRAVPHGESAYQVYVAAVKYEEASVPTQQGSRHALRIVGLDRPVRVTPKGSTNGGGCFSPDGFSLVFATDGGGGAAAEGAPRLHLVRADNWKANVIAAAAGTPPGQPVAADLSANTLTASNAPDTDPTFSPDGRTVCFVGNGAALYVMRPDGTEVRPLTVAGGRYASPAFSPDGRALVYAAVPAGSPAETKPQVFKADLTFDPAGSYVVGLGPPTPLTHDDATHANPTWHPDGQHVAYATDRDGGDYELYLMTRDGGRKTRLTFRPGADLYPTFSSGWQYLMWTSDRSDDGTPQVFVADFQLPPGS